MGNFFFLIQWCYLTFEDSADWTEVQSCFESISFRTVSQLWVNWGLKESLGTDLLHYFAFFSVVLPSVVLPASMTVTPLISSVTRLTVLRESRWPCNSSHWLTLAMPTPFSTSINDCLRIWNVSWWFFPTFSDESRNQGPSSHSKSYLSLSFQWNVGC